MGTGGIQDLGNRGQVWTEKDSRGRRARWRSAALRFYVSFKPAKICCLGRNMEEMLVLILSTWTKASNTMVLMMMVTVNP